MLDDLNSVNNDYDGNNTILNNIMITSGLAWPSRTLGC